MWSIIALVLILKISYVASVPFFEFPTDDSNIQLKKLQFQLEELVLSPVPAACNSSSKAVMFTIVSNHHFDLIALQHKSMEIFGEEERQCFAAR